MNEKVGEYETKFSIIVPVYQSAATIERCICSILEQSFDDFELILVDDGSTDDSYNVIAKYLSDSRVAYRRIAHTGVSVARNIGIKSAIGEYILFCDADDELIAGALSTLRARLDGESDITVFGAVVQNCGDSFVLNDIATRDKVYSGKDVLTALYHESGARPYVWNSCYRRDFLVKSNVEFAKDVLLGEDQLFQFAAFCAARQVRFISDKLYRHYFCSPSSVNKRYLNDQIERMKCHFGLVYGAKEILTRNNMPSDENFAKWIINFLFADFMSLEKSARKELTPHCKKLLKEIEITKQVKDLRNKLKLQIMKSVVLQNLYKQYMRF